MRFAVAVVLLAACGHSPHSVPDGALGDGGTDGAADAGIDGPSDGAIDAPIDAMPCTAPDTDGDGVCDTQDLCPDVADPGQADLDGDHIGWMCDPVESVTLVGDGNFPDVVTSIHENTFAARTRYQYVDYDAVGHSIVQVGATGAVVTRSDSTAPEDAWQAATTTPWLDGPIVTSDDHVLWSRGYYVGETGDFDVATHTFTARANGVLNPVEPPDHLLLYLGTSLEAVSLSTAQGGATTDFVDVRAGGTLVPVATAQSFMDLSGHDLQAIPGTTHALVPVRRNFREGLQLYTQGAAALEDLIVDGAPLTNLDELQPMLVDGNPSGYCAERGAQSYYVGWDAAGAVVAYELPAGCGDDLVTDRGGARFFHAASGMHDVISYVVAGTFHSITTGALARIQGTTLPLLIVSPTDVWQIAADGTASVVASGSDYVGASMVGDTIHLLEFHRYPNDPNNRGDYVLTRIRSGQAPQSVTVISNAYSGSAPSVMTTAEGAALISGGPYVVVPSQSMTPVTAPVGEMSGGVRDGRTVVFGHPTLTSLALYAYTEVNGAPTFTMLDTPRLQGYGGLIDTPQGPTSWFKYSNGTNYCNLARFTTGMALESVPCPDPLSVHVLGTRSDGTLLVGTGANVFALTSTGAQSVAASTGFEQAILDTTMTPPVLVGWSVRVGMQGYSCLASHPDRCWLYPYTNTTRQPSTYASAGADTFQHVIVSYQALGQATVTVVRSIGPGNFTP